MKRRSLMAFDRPEVMRFTCRREREADLRRGSRQERGYDAAWEKLSLEHRKKEPLCRECDYRGYARIAELVDHIIPIRDRPELRLDPKNLQALCQRCHDTRKRWMESDARKQGDINLLALWFSDPATRPPQFKV